MVQLLDNNGNFDGIDLKKLGEEKKEPFYIYSENKINEAYNKLRAALPENMRIFYSMKANPNISIVNILYKLGAGIEIASGGELIACKKIGVKPGDIVFAGPAKDNEELELAVDYGIHSINAEVRLYDKLFYNELQKINEIAKRLKKVQNVNLRINLNSEIEGAVTMSGGSKKFGVDEEVAGEIKDVISLLKNVRLRGIHVFSATQLFNQEKVLENIELGLKMANQCREYFDLEVIDIGTGFGIPYSENEDEMNLDGANAKIESLLEHYNLKDTEFIMESGRFLVGLSGTYVAPILDIKESRGRDFVLIKGGINHLLRPALINTNHSVKNLSSDAELTKVDIGGQLCTSLDFIAKDININSPTIGDVLCVFQAGAYGYTEAMPFFLSHNTPKEFLIKDGEVLLIRESFTAEDLLSKQYLK